MADKKKGLIVDDLPASRVEIREHAEAMGHEFEEAASVEEARAKLAGGEFDYVVLDLQLPMREGRPDKIEYGRALLTEIVRDHPYVAVVVVTAHGTTDEHIVGVMSASPLVTYVAKPFDERPGRTRLTVEIQAVLGRAESYRRGGVIPGTTPPREEETQPPPIATIDIYKIRRHRNKGWVCRVNGEEVVFSDERYRVLAAFAAAQRSRTDHDERHTTVVDAESFGIKDINANLHPTVTRLRKQLWSSLGENYPDILKNEAYRQYSLGCICIDSSAED